MGLLEIDGGEEKRRTAKARKKKKKKRERSSVWRAFFSWDIFGGGKSQAVRKNKKRMGEITCVDQAREHTAEVDPTRPRCLRRATHTEEDAWGVC
ncbi:hypothetical protein BHE74_00033738 [Ensete ventricosum]|nr:hypothetical protein BHE74_00033738 [Ensete ventricosum]RZS02294.1 hypothetical protein BHM03_00032314 [Ensete ventricosum]